MSWTHCLWSVLSAMLLAAAPLTAEFLSFEIEFEDSGCIPCTESLESRLKRIRGAEKVTVDFERGVIQLELEQGNRVRLGPLQARITQDGTKIRSISFVAIGSVTDGKFTPSGLTQALPLRDQMKDAGSLHLKGRLGDGVVVEASEVAVQL